MPDPHYLDVRTLAPAEKHPRIFGAIAALAPGASLYLLNDHAPVMLASRLEELGPGRYRLEMLENGPPVWRFRVLRVDQPRAQAPPPGAPQAPA
jgi:uncharacterized protein (DUF2249 family)